MTDRELVYRMRTCAAALMSAELMSDQLRTDAGYLLIEAADALDAPYEPLPEDGAPMAIPDARSARTAPSAAAAIWGGLPEATARACPKCGGIDARTVHRAGHRLILTCPVCSYQWEYEP